MKNKTLSIATLLLTGALLFAGCGQTGNTTGNTSSTTAGQETATTEQTDSTAQTASDSTASTNDIFTNMDTTDIDGNKMHSRQMIFDLFCTVVCSFRWIPFKINKTPIAKSKIPVTERFLIFI